MKLGYRRATYLASVLLWMASVECALGAHQWVYLETVAATYIKEINETYKGGVNFWSLRDDFSYWKRHHHRDKHPVKGEVDWSEYYSCKGEETLRENETDCVGLFSWTIHEGINSPFSLSTYAILPEVFKGLNLKVFSFNVNGLRKTSDEEKWGKLSHKVHRTLYEACKFSVKIQFSGFFVYFLSHPTNGNFQWVLVPITALAGRAKGLKKEGEKLTYLVRGQYTEQLFCNDPK